METTTIREGSRPPLIWALETYELHGRPTCSECTDKERRRLGCPLDDPKAKGRALRFTSPILQDDEKDRLTYQCPVGLNLKNDPWVYELIELANVAENASIKEWAGLSLFAQRGIRLYRSEKERLREAKRKQQQAFRDSRTGMGAR